MTQEIVPDLQSLNFIVKDVSPTGKKLGEGSYGIVEEAEIRGATCVIKKLHEVLLPDPTEAHGADRMIETFIAECRLMSNLHHPHIVQFLGICFLPGSRLPALLMEKLTTDLHNLLIKNADIPLDMKCSFLLGIAKGLTYLHNKKPPIIHRDLSARNILLNSAMVAKIADLGNARIINVRPGRLMTMTKNPGNMWYMPPEVQDDTSQYDSMVDIFSFGVLTLFTLTQKFPNTKPATYANPQTGKVFGRSEIERRHESFTQIRHDLSLQHPLVQLAELCLQNLPTNRPSIAAVMHMLEEARKAIPEQYSCMSKLDMVYTVQHQQREIELQQAQLQSLSEQSNADEDRVMKQQQDIEVQQRQIEMRQEQIEAHRNTIDTQNSEMKVLRQELEIMTNEVEMKQEKIETQQVQLKVQQDCIQSIQESHTERQFQAATIPNDGSKKRSQKFNHLREMQYTTTSFQWEKCRDLPMGVVDAQSTCANGKIYLGFTEFLVMEQCGCREHILEYTPNNDEWIKLPPPPVQHFAMATVNNKLVLVGGKMSNKIIVWENNSRKWLPNAYPPMMKTRYHPSAIGYQHYLVVAGGKDDNSILLSTVEVLDTMASQWYGAEHLPIACSNMTPVVIQDTLYLFYKDWSERHISVLVAPLPTLILHATSQSNKVNIPKTWTTIPKAPLYRFTPFTVGKALLVAGGTKDPLYTEKSSEIFCYSAARKQWVLVGRLPAPRWRSTCVGLSSSKLLLIGGDVQQSIYSGIVSVA